LSTREIAIFSHLGFLLQIESASRPLMGCGDLNNNIIKELTCLLKNGWAEIYLYMNLFIGSWDMQSNEDILVNVKQSMKEK